MTVNEIECGCVFRDGHWLWACEKHMQLRIVNPDGSVEELRFPTPDNSGGEEAGSDGTE